MGKEFFNGWPLWEKLCFVLGAAIVVTILAGCGKLWWSHWQLRKYTAVDAAKRAQPEEMRQAPKPSRARGNDIPFGVRAIESGIEVDGVWISRTNTPAPSSPRSLAPAPVAVASSSSQRVRQDPKRASTASEMSRLEIPQPAYGQTPSIRIAKGSSDSGSTSRPPSSFDRAVSAERLPTRSSSPGSGVEDRYRPRHHSQLRYSSHNLLRDSTTLDSLEGRQRRSKHVEQREKDSDEERSPKHSSGSSSESGSNQTHYYPTRPSRARHNSSSGGSLDGIRTPIDARPFTESRRSENLDSLRAHRLSHAAETGQFIPRTQRGVASGDWSNAVPSQAPLVEQGDYFNPRLSSTGQVAQDNPFATPAGVRVPRSPYIDAPSEQDMGMPKSDQQQAEPLLHQYEPTESVTNHQYTDFNHPRRQSRNVRKVNSGFEVHPQGSVPLQEYNYAGLGRPEEWDHDLETGDRRQSRRLQKKRRDSASKASSFVEQI
ncbi:MAG: hypothetical protein M1812_007147 [Candelaria pacifica]|nr:MAG: hypothetical protein M1812_007147 [Candelaria pacifica]